MPPAQTFFSLLVVLSFFSLSIASGQLDPNIIRIPLQRRSLITHRDRNAVGSVDKDFLKSHAADVAMKYFNAFAAYESNTGSPHPLARAFFSKGVTISGPFNYPTSSEPARAGHLTKRDDISLAVVNSNMWMGTISVGTPPQNFTVDFDTGSSDLILPNQACDSTCDGHTRYDPTASSTSTNLNKVFMLSYRGGSSVNGSQYADNVYMGGYEAANQTLGAATTYSPGLSSPTFRPDGLLGMAFSPLSTLHTSPVFQTMVSSGVVAQGVFGFALSSESGRSELTIGGTNTNMYQEATTEYVKVPLPGFWQLPLAALSRPGLNSTPDVVVVNKTSYAQAIVDTGTTLIVTSDDIARAYYANVPGARPSADIGGGVWSVPCDTIGSLAPTLTFGSRNFTVSSSTFNLGPVFEGSTDCIAGLAGGGSAWWIIGDVFLQNVYSIFDVTNTRVGFADLA